MVIIERTHAGIGADDVGGRNRCLVILARPFAEIGDLLRRDLNGVAIGLIGHIGRADQRELAALIGDREHDAAIAILEEIGIIALMPARHDDVAALHKAQMRLLWRVTIKAKHVVHPGPGRVHNRAEFARLLTLRTFQHGLPMIGMAHQRRADRARQNLCTALSGIHGIQNDQP